MFVEICQGCDVTCFYSCRTTATTKDRAVRNTIGIKACSSGTYRTTEQVDSGLTAVQEVVCIVRFVGLTNSRLRIIGTRPQVTCECPTLTGSRIVISTTGIVALTNGSHVTTAIDEPSHFTIFDSDRGVAINLTGCQAVNILIVSQSP